jgi:hypothetical protein
MNLAMQLSMILSTSASVRERGNEVGLSSSSTHDNIIAGHIRLGECSTPTLSRSGTDWYLAKTAVNNDIYVPCCEFHHAKVLRCFPFLLLLGSIFWYFDCNVRRRSYILQILVLWMLTLMSRTCACCT